MEKNPDIKDYFENLEEETFFDVIKHTTCCGLFEINGISANDKRISKKFVEQMSDWAKQALGKESKDGYFTHWVDSALYKIIKKEAPAGIKIVHEWTNANTRRKLFMAIVSPVYKRRRKPVASSKKKAVRK